MKGSSEMMEGGETFVLDMGIAKVIDIANELISQCGEGTIKEIGTSPGEKLYEELFTDVESFRTVLFDGIYIILPEENNMNDCFKSVLKKYSNLNRICTPLRSDNKKTKTVDYELLVKSLILDKDE